MFQPGALVDRYKVEELLPDGPGGPRFRVVHRETGVQRLLEAIHVGRSDVAHRLVREGRLRTGLRHPNVVQVHEAILLGEDIVGVVQDWIDGPDLETWLSTTRPGIAEVELVFRDLIAAVAHAHRTSIVHGALEPAHVRLGRLGDDGENGRWVALAGGFGILPSVFAVDGMLPLGDVRFRAPEQLRGDEADPRSDLWGLGCLLYLMVCRQPPFSAEDADAVHEEAMAGRWIPPESLAVDCPEHIGEAIRACLLADPDKRAPDTETLLRVLAGDALLPRQRRYVQPRSEPVESTWGGDDDTLPLLGEAYRLGNVLGVRGPITTLRATAIQDERVVVVKSHRLSDIDEACQDRVQDARHALSHLGHPAVLPFFDQFVEQTVEGPCLCVVRDFAVGRPLGDLVSRKRLAEEQVVPILEALFRVLDEMHTSAPPFAHLALRPHNVVLGDDGRVTLLDAAIVRDALPLGDLATDVRVGTGGYAAPERWDHEAGLPADVFSAAAIAVYLLTRRDPAELGDEVWAQLGRVTPGFRAFLQHCMQRTPEARPTAARARAMLGDLASVRPPRAPRPSRASGNEPAEWIQRTVLAAALGAVLVALVALVIAAILTFT